MQTVLITGVSSGIGLATAECLVNSGFRVIGTTRFLKKHKQLQAAWKHKFGDRLQLIEMDITNDKQVNAAIAYVRQHFKRLDILICNAGFSVFGSIEDVPLELAQKQFDTNLFGQLRVIKTALPVMREQREGKIIIISSMGGFVTIPWCSHYSASKHALEAFNEGLRQEFNGTGIQITALRPGYVKTNVHNNMTKYIAPQSIYSEKVETAFRQNDAETNKGILPAKIAEKILKILKKKKFKAFYHCSDAPTRIVAFLYPFIPMGLREKLVMSFSGNTDMKI